MHTSPAFMVAAQSSVRARTIPSAKWRGNCCQKPLLAAGQTMLGGRGDGLACDSVEAFISMSGVERPVFMSTVFDKNKYSQPIAGSGVVDVP